MVEPIAFGFNAETAVNNYFQLKDNVAEYRIQQLALQEFIRMVEILRSKGINVITVKDTETPHTPDSIFPNNWISFHEDGSIAIYPMYAKNRRAERREDILGSLKESGYIITYTVDYSKYEKENKYLEGTGSMVLDRAGHIAYAALSERTDKELFNLFCKEFGYKPFFFHANQTVGNKREPIYHTNVMMCIGDKYVIICLDSIDDKSERNALKHSFAESQKEIIDISENQMHCFAGNMLQVRNKDEETFLVMSQTAYNCLTDNQKKRISYYNEIISVSIPTIERYGGGSARCMMAEVFLPSDNMQKNSVLINNN